MDGSRGLGEKYKNYNQNSKQLHRQHRSLMQWKGAPTATGMKTKLEGEGGGYVKSQRRGCWHRYGGLEGFGLSDDNRRLGADSDEGKE